MAKKVFRAIAVAALLAAAIDVSAQRGGRGAAPALPEGAGKEIVQERCAACHSLSLITNSGYARDEWVSLFTTMVSLPADDAKKVADYLTAKVPAKPRPKAVILPGNTTINIKEWVVPSLGSRPHDPPATPDGKIW